MLFLNISYIQNMLLPIITTSIVSHHYQFLYMVRISTWYQPNRVCKNLYHLLHIISLLHITYIDKKQFSIQYQARWTFTMFCYTMSIFYNNKTLSKSILFLSYLLCSLAIIRKDYKVPFVIQLVDYIYKTNNYFISS